MREFTAVPVLIGPLCLNFHPTLSVLMPIPTLIPCWFMVRKWNLLIKGGRSGLGPVPTTEETWTQKMFFLYRKGFTGVSKGFPARVPVQNS